MYVSTADRLLDWMPSKCNFQIFALEKWGGKRERELSLQSGIASSFLASLRNSSLLKKKKKKDPFLAQCYSRTWMFLKAALGVPVDHLKYWITVTKFGDCVWCLLMCFTHKPEIDEEVGFFLIQQHLQKACVLHFLFIDLKSCRIFKLIEKETNYSLHSIFW